MTRSRRQPAPAPLCSGCQVDPQALGQVQGKLDLLIDGQKAHGAKLEAMDGRLRKVETRTAVTSSGLGAAAGLIMATCVELVRNALRRS